MYHNYYEPEINTFEDLYAEIFILEDGIKGWGWHAKKENNDSFVLDGGHSGRIYIQDQRDGVRFEFLSGCETVVKEYLPYKDAYELCMERMDRKAPPAGQWSREKRQDGFLPFALKLFFRIVGFITGVVLGLGSAFLLFAIWFSYETETPFYVYLSLSFSFGTGMLVGIALIFLSVRKKGRRKDITEK